MKLLTYINFNSIPLFSNMELTDNITFKKHFTIKRNLQLIWASSVSVLRVVQRKL